VIGQQLAHPLVSIACFVLDFLCIHPFRDGNGRVSRLVTLLALYHHGYEVGRYISLERLIEETKEDYYRALFESSQNWHEGRHDILPWLNYFLSTLRRAYRLFETRVSTLENARGMKTTLIQHAIEAFTEDFTMKRLENACPTVSRELIRVVLKDLQKRGQVKSLGRGPGAVWRKI
jgi:Fic family protein